MDGASGAVTHSGLVTEEPVDVLIVDDQRPFRSVARTVVDLVGGWRVAAEAETGEDAVAAAERVRPGVVLMDINLPGISGIEATRRIIASYPETTVVLLSTYAAADLPAEATTCGADDVPQQGGPHAPPPCALCAEQPSQAGAAFCAHRSVAPTSVRSSRVGRHDPDTPSGRLRHGQLASAEIPPCAERRVSTARRGRRPRRPSG